MTQKELHNQRLVKEAQEAYIRMQTRRHFLKQSAMGLGALAMGSLICVFVRETRDWLAWLDETACLILVLFVE